MEDYRRCQIPKFGNWDLDHNLPITQYFESARQAGLLPKKVDEDKFRGDFKQPIPAIRKKQITEVITGTQKRHQYGKEQKKQGRVCDVTEAPRQPRASKAVDEDLYKIPPELLQKKPKNKLMGFLSRMFGWRRASDSYYY